MIPESRKPQQPFDSMIAVLSDEIELYKQIGDALHYKQQAIIDGNVEELRKRVYEEQKLIQQAQTLAETRMAQIAAIEATNKINEKIGTLKAVIKLAPPTYAIELENLRHRLKYNLNRITQTNDENRYLLNSSIEYVKGLVNIFLQTDDKPTKIYSREGMISASDKSMIVLDCQI